MNLDRYDRAILSELQQDGRISNVHLAAAVSLSESACLRRVRALEEAGLIQRYVALLDQKKVGLTGTVFVHIALRREEQAQLAELKAELHDGGIGEHNRVFNLSWHDWLNLKSLLDVSEVIAAAGLSRENSRGAHYREDFPEVGSLEDSYFTVAGREGGSINVRRQAVDFSIVKPGESLIDD